MNFVYNLNFLNHQMKTRSKNKNVTFGGNTIFDGKHQRSGSKPDPVRLIKPKMDAALKNTLWFPSNHATRTAKQIQQEKRQTQRAADMTRLIAAVRRNKQKQ